MAILSLKFTLVLNLLLNITGAKTNSHKLTDIGATAIHFSPRRGKASFASQLSNSTLFS